MAFALVLRAQRRLERVLLLDAPASALPLDRLASDGGEHRRRLLPAHDRDPGVGPHPEKAWVEGAPAHAVIARAVGAADDHRELGHVGARHRRYHLGSVLGDAAGLVLAADHEAGDVLKEDERYAPL